jgi:hypothetical protein
MKEIQVYSPSSLPTKKEVPLLGLPHKSGKRELICYLDFKLPQMGILLYFHLLKDKFNSSLS